MGIIERLEDELYEAEDEALADALRTIIELKRRVTQLEARDVGGLR